MILEFFKYATRLLKNNMTTIILGTTTITTTTLATITTATTTTAITTQNFNITTNASNITNAFQTSTLPPQLVIQSHPQYPQQIDYTSKNNNDMLPERPTVTYPTLVQHLNTTIKALFNKTLNNVVKANSNNYTDEYTTPKTTTTPTTITTTTIMPPNANHSRLMVEDNLSRGGVSTVMFNLSTLPTTTRYAIGTTATTTTFPAQTVSTFMAAGNKNRATIIVYPTVSPESIVIPIVSCIFGFPILAFLVICCLRRRAKLARERDRRRNYDMQDHAVSLVRFSPIHRLNYRPTRAISLRPERSLSQGFTSLELDTVVEERCSDIEQTQTELLNAESPMETTTSSYQMSYSS